MLTCRATPEKRIAQQKIAQLIVRAVMMLRFYLMKSLFDRSERLFWKSVVHLSQQVSRNSGAGLRCVDDDA